MASAQNEPIAIIGTGCRFPGGSTSTSKLWDLLSNPRDVSREIGTGRFNLDRFYHRDGSHHGTTNTRRAYQLSDDIHNFDAKFFGISPGEAEAIDPQQRLLLEVVYEALESAAIPIKNLSGSDTSVYVGLMCQDFFTIQAQDNNYTPTYGATGSAPSNASSRISYFFDWHGPSMTIDTACSSSMVAVHSAVQSLRNGTSRVAVACGTNLMLSPFMYVALSKLSMLSPTGRCQMWDADCDGYARGEGVVSVVLKTLSAAMEDGDDIACVIREIGLNHDGRTKGITMPSASAQAALIRSTYARAGLDLTTKEGRCQFFEAHGTGTPAGDPQEAEGISKAFFSDSTATEDEILVGSIKTLAGHTEGSAGLAGILKACLSLQHSTILPNLWFNRLNPKLEPFTKNLRIPVKCEPWPKLPEGTPRRASVNSFGFGGANAHCILESYMPVASLSKPLTNGYHQPDPLLIPFVFSAASLKSLIALLKSTSEYLDNNPEVDMASLAHTLSTKRSALSRRIAIYASSVEQLQSEIKKRLDDTLNEVTTTHSVVALSTPPSILGIFTGQGAQWPMMGAKLVASNSMARTILKNLDQSLASLPACHRPSWTLIDELAATKDTSRVGEAAFSQPLCTAVQIILVDLLRASGVKFRAVVGHSSGEIAAAYAAGFLAASDAIRIAYYRGYFAKLAAGSADEKGSMLALGTDFEDASEFCEIDDIVDRICVAAHNSPTSVTLSGDIEAITEAQGVFEEEQKFARVLKVDTAYHSAHMKRCSSAYQTALAECQIQILRPEGDAPEWFSSVHNAKIETGLDSLSGEYWVDNMVQPVLFYPALRTCLTSVEKTINCALEVGCHPALQGPAKESILEIIGRDIPYSGTLKRGNDDMEIFSEALGFVWTHFGSDGIDLGAFQMRINPHAEVKTVHGLPSYPWSYDISSWTESRKSKLFTTQAGKFHDLLGLQTPDGVAEEWRWRNILNPNELKWLSGHTLQGQVVFPGTGYIGLGMEAAMQIAHDRPVKSIDIFDLEIRKAIAIHDIGGTELLVSLNKVSPLESVSGTITADFTVFSTISKNSSQLALNCCGNICITLGAESGSHFPPRVPPVTEMSKVSVDQFYQVMKDEYGFGYEGPFRGLTDISRRFGHSIATVKCHPFEAGDTTLLFHPAMLDSALQGLQAAFSAPGDGRLWSIVAPTYFRRVTLIPSLCGENMTEEVAIDCTMTDPGVLGGDVDVYSANFEQKIIEMEGIILSPFAPATADDDRELFQESFLCLDKPDAVIVTVEQTPEVKQKSRDAERVAFYYLKTLHLSVSTEDREKLPWYRQALLRSAEHRYNQIKDGRHMFALQSWIDDKQEEVYEIMNRYGNHDADFSMSKAVGENILSPDVLSGDTNILEHMLRVGLEQYYTQASGFKLINAMVSGVVAQICSKYPHMNFLEIGAGTGGATGAILERIGHSFSSYTYTDISSGFFERATERFQSQIHKIEFKTLDITKDPVSQDLIPNSYDIVIASNVLHATAPLKETLKHTRKLLKPGGFLVLVELIRNDSMRVGQIMGGLPGWWCGEDDGRLLSPLLTLEGWDELLQETGFGGIETNSPLPIPEDNGAIIVSKAQNDQVRRLSKPLNTVPEAGHEQGTLVILGGKRAPTSKLCKSLHNALRPHFKIIISMDHLSSLPGLPQTFHVISLTECDENLFEALDESTFQNLKRLLGAAESVLWVLQGSLSTNLYAGVTLGFFRTISHEYSAITGGLLQTLDIGSDTTAVSSQQLADSVLQLREQSSMRKGGESNHVLWNFEPELHLENGHFMVPRIRQNENQNARYNSSKRSINTLVNVSGPTTLCLHWANGLYTIREQHEIETSSADEDVTIQVSCSYLASLKTPSGFVFVSLGTDMKSGEKTLCLSSQNASILKVPQSWTLRIDDAEFVDGHFMSFVVADLMAEQVLRMLPATGTVVALEPDPVVSALLSKKMADKGRKILLITSKTKAKSKNWVYLHPHSSQRLIDASLPAETTLFADVSGNHTDPQSLGSRIAASLSSVCEKITFSSLVGREASRLPQFAPEGITELLMKATAFALSSLQLGPVPIADVAPINVLPLTQVVSSTQTPSLSSLIYWQIDQYVPVTVEPIIDRKDLFRPDRTYWLAGLSGALGQSLADFMVARNAKYVVLSSRSPKIDEGWVEWHKSRGVTVQYLQGDVTSFESIKQNYDEIKLTLPSIGGVANGAMVLRDGGFSTTSLEDFQAGLLPKIQGTINLDRLFSEPNESLDWFLGFSSLAEVIGNPGQSAYSAGNGCMRAIVNNRRSRGQAGSVIHISRITGIGYIERELTKENQERLKIRSGTLAMSEVDLHHLFAESIVAGRPNSGMNPELITGLGTITTEQSKEVFWSQNAKMGLLIREVGRGGVAIGGDKGSSIPVRKLLEAAKDIQEAKIITVGALRAKLQAMQFLPDSDNLQNTTALVDLGIDSLIAVDTRAWFGRELRVDVPVMKILGGASMADLVDFAFENLPQELLSQWGVEANQANKTPAVIKPEPAEIELMKGVSEMDESLPDQGGRSRGRDDMVEKGGPLELEVIQDSEIHGKVKIVDVVVDEVNGVDGEANGFS